MKKPCDELYMVVPTFEDALAYVAQKTYIYRTFVIGGSDVYKRAIEHPSCENVYLTQVVYTTHLPDHNPIQYDAFFPLARMKELYYGVDDDWCSDGPILYRFSTWYRN
jgi:dihydrofolate reductase